MPAGAIASHGCRNQIGSRLVDAVSLFLAIAVLGVELRHFQVSFCNILSMNTNIYAALNTIHEAHFFNPLNLETRDDYWDSDPASVTLTSGDRQVVCVAVLG